MAEIESKESYAENLKKKLCTLFLHTTFTEPKFLVGNIAKQFDIDVSDVSLTKTETHDGYDVYSLKMLDAEFAIIFSHKVEELKDRQVPKLVKTEKKWWQVGEPDTKVIIETVKPKAKERNYWVLSSIST